MTYEMLLFDVALGTVSCGLYIRRLFRHPRFVCLYSIIDFLFWLFIVVFVIVVTWSSAEASKIPHTGA
jgi:hypothetical protein